MIKFDELGRPDEVSQKNWNSWKWQLKNLQKGDKSPKNQGFWAKKPRFLSGATPYYLKLLDRYPVLKPIVKISPSEAKTGLQSLHDPLGERQHSPFSRLIHRYPDRVLFLVTDQCGVYCRYCTRKRFTGKKQAFASQKEQEELFFYLKSHPGIREVILSGGDPLTLSDSRLESLLQKIREIPHIEIIRIASRLPTVCPMRLSQNLCSILKRYQPVFLMTHFNHPLELSREVQSHLKRVADSGILMFNQTVLLQGVNNHPAIIQALMRRLIYLRVKPYYMFQCDPSEGSDHFRTSIPNSQWLQKELWGRFSGLSLPNLSVDIPGGGGKVGLTPDFAVQKDSWQWQFKGWDGVEGTYKNPKESNWAFDPSCKIFEKEWNLLKKQAYGQGGLKP